ncbi:hypothetical protein KFK09_020541 [Dendrobium nobile]|uniref:Uncharacterized protein n=1 Tax=Dendrobium nobile TaxID=94219 RepID=A0A8T3AMS8_DENNO|nr:hypothetical protein KFK09_020541 [Dendrobium nobile]
MYSGAISTLFWCYKHICSGAVLGKGRKSRTRFQSLISIVSNSTNVYFSNSNNLVAEAVIQ